MLTAGVDLAASPAASAVALVADGTVVAVAVGAGDDAIVDLTSDASKIGIDCPLGWPVAFTDFIGTVATGGPVPARESVAGRAELAYRATDRWIARHHPPLRPLSVSADRIAHVAFRCALLLSQLAASGEPVDRAGSGTVVEVYPAGSLCCWGLQHRSYKGNDSLAALSDCVDALLEVTSPWLKLGAFEELCRKRDDAFDALIAALTARAAMLGLTTRPQDSELERARREGWIALPTRPLAELHERAVQHD